MTLNPPKSGSVRLIVLPDLTDRTKAGGEALATPPPHPCKPSLSTKSGKYLTDKADLTDKTHAKHLLRVIVDSREQAPFTFTGYPVEVTAGTLASGDYSLHGFTDRIGIERKSLQDLIGCLGIERDRFTRELARLRGFDSACVIVEASSDDLRRGLYRSKLDAGAAWQSVLAFIMRYRIPFVWCRDRADAEAATFDLLRHYARDRARELAALGVGHA